MTLFLWLVFLTCFFVSSGLLISYLLKHIRLSESLKILISGLKVSLHDSGFSVQRTRYPVELYRWKLSDECMECDDCIDRSTWEPMDIADWMQEGLPGTPEAETECGHYCRCQLILVKKKVVRY